MAFDINPMSLFRIRNLLQGGPEAYGDTPMPLMPGQNLEQEPIEPQATMPTNFGAPTNNPEFNIPIEESPEIDYQRRMLELYKPERDASDRLEALVGRMPQRNNPGFWRKLAASFGGFGGGIGTADRLLYAPYYNKMADWKNEYEPAQDLAREERLGNNSQRMMANSMISQEMSDRRLQRLMKKDQTNAGFQERRVSLAENTAEDKSKQAWTKIRIQEELAKGGTVKTNDTTGKTFLVTRTGELVELPDLAELGFKEKETFKTNENIREDKATPGSGRAPQRDRLTLKVNADGSHTVINLDKEVAKEVKTEEGVTSKAPVNELDKNRALTAKALQVKSANPEWSKWILFDENGRFTGIKDQSWFGDKETYNKVYSSIYGTPGHVPGFGGTSRDTKLNKVRVRRKSDGATGTMNSNDPKLQSGLYEIIK